MILYSDAPDFTRLIFPDVSASPDLTQNISGWVPPFFNSLTITSFLSNFEDWKYAVIVEQAQRSQFDVLLELSRKHPNLPSGIVAIAKTGSGFHGFHGRKWQSATGNVHLCVYFNPDQELDGGYFHQGLIILGTVSVVQTIDRFSELKSKAAIRWLNDIFIDGYKVGGVLTHSQTQGNILSGALIGVGLNVAVAPKIETDKIIAGATCLAKYAAHIDLGEVIRVLLERLAQNAQLLFSGGYNELFAQYKQRSEILGKKISVYSDPASGRSKKLREGQVLEINPDLSIILKNHSVPVSKGRIEVQ